MTAPLTRPVEIRRELHPGDLGTIIREHGRRYSIEHGVDRRFEAMVAAAVGRAAERGWPGDREGVWIVEQDGEFAGCLALTEESADLAAIRFVLLGPSLRGRGLGRREEIVYQRSELSLPRGRSASRDPGALASHA